MTKDIIRVEIDPAEVASLVQHLTPAAMQAAWRRTLRKTGNWMKGQTARAASQSASIPQKVLRQRLYFFMRSKDTGKVWIGLNPIEAHRLGKPRQTKKGVAAGRHRFEGAWLKKNNPSKGVFRRDGKDRTPYSRVSVDWDKQGEAAAAAAAQAAEQRFMVILRQEVNYELQKAIGRAK